jgi:glycine/D-amino acid oxidase-like deaminating enzyme
LTEKLKNKAIIIIGAGHFGQRAAALLNSVPHTSLWIVDRDLGKLKKMGRVGAKRIAEDGIRFLAKHFSHLAPSTFIVPAVPVHLAFEWLRAYIHGEGSVSQVPVPRSFGLRLPHTSEGSEGSLLASYADFRCPDDCSEPPSRCTVTGKARGTPLYRLLAEAVPRGFRTHVIRSRQLAPGVGGYRVEDLRELLGKVSETGKGKWLVATACKCHGVVTGLTIGR